MADGLMSKEDFSKLEGIAADANKYVHPDHTGDVTSTGDGETTIGDSKVTTAKIANDTVENTKLANMAANTIKGNNTASSADPKDLTAAQVRTLLNVADGANNYTHPNHSGDVTSVGDGTTTIGNGKVSNAKLAVVGTGTLKGRTAAGDGAPSDLTFAQVKTALELDNVLNVAQIPASEKGVADGVATLDEAGKVPSSQLPSYVDDVVESDTKNDFPTTGEAGKIYVALDDNKTYRWSGSAYVEISASLALGETSNTAYRGDRGKTAYDHSQSAHAPSNAQKNSDITSAEITDSLGYTPVNKAGDSMLGKLSLPASKAAEASLNTPHGAAPTSPVNGDIWTTTSGLYVRLNGTTRTMAHTSQWSAMTQAEAEAGTGTTARLVTALALKQAIDKFAAPIAHVDLAASTSQAGHVQLSSATNSTSETEAATPKAVKAAYDAAFSALGTLQYCTIKVAITIGDGTTTSFVVPHGRGTQDVMVTVREVASPFAVVYADIEMMDINNVKVSFATAPTTNQFRVTVIG